MAILASAPAHATRIVVITHGQASDAFWSVVKKGVDDAGALMGVEVQYQAPQTFDMVAMKQLIDAAVASQPDGLVVSIPDAEALGDSIKAAVAAGIPVISMDSGLEVSEELGALLHMGIDEYPSGFAAGQKMKELGKTSGACVNMEVGNVALDLRCQGFADALDGNSQVIATSNDPTEIRAGVGGYLQQHGEIDAVLTAGATAFDPALAAIEEAGLTEQIAIGSFDLSPTMLAGDRRGQGAVRHRRAAVPHRLLPGDLPHDLRQVRHGADQRRADRAVVRDAGHGQAGDRAQPAGLPLICRSAAAARCLGASGGSFTGGSGGASGGASGGTSGGGSPGLPGGVPGGSLPVARAALRAACRAGFRWRGRRHLGRQVRPRPDPGQVGLSPRIEVHVASGASWLILAAMMKSFSCRPLILWVWSEIVA